MMPINTNVINNRRRSNQAGMTLIEIMIALLLGLFLIAGLLQIFVNNKQSYRLSENQSRLQENARYALEMLNHDIRLSGFMGCSFVTTTGTLNPVVIANAPMVIPVIHHNVGLANVIVASAVRGGDDNPHNVGGTFSSPDPPMSTSPLNNAIIGTDAITVQYAESCGGYVTGDISTVNPTGSIAAGNTCGINLGTGTTFATLGTPLIISDCKTAHLFRASAAATQNKDNLGNDTSILEDKPAPGYAAGSEIMLYRSYTYFIRLGASGQPALWRLNNNYPVPPGNSNPEEMIEGVENMQILYGIETDTPADAANLVDTSANRYVEAENIPDIDTIAFDDWRRVVSVRINLTVRSIEDNILPTDNPDRSYNGSNTYKDRRLIKTFTTTIELRNR